MLLNSQAYNDGQLGMGFLVHHGAGATDPGKIDLLFDVVKFTGDFFTAVSPWNNRTFACESTAHLLVSLPICEVVLGRSAHSP